MLARPPPGNEDSSEADDSKATKDQDKALTRSKDQDKASKDEELQTKKERLKNSATINNVQPNLENDAAPIRSDVDLSEERPEDKAAQRSSSCETSADSRKEFVQTPHSILKTQTKPEFEGEFLSWLLLMFDVVERNSPYISLTLSVLPQGNMVENYGHCCQLERVM